MVKKFDRFSQEQKLKNYADGKIKYQPQMNLFLNDRTRKWYDELGQYFLKIIGTLKGKWSEFFEYRMSMPNRDAGDVVIFFITSFLDEKSLRTMFGEPVLHNEFGEGFHGDYNDETDEESEPDIKEQYASYFLNINGVECHIGYDHRGTSIEIINGTTTQQAFDAIKYLMDLFKKKCQ